MGRKWQALIADDEQKVCQLIQYLVPWDELDINVAAAVSNGLEAMDILKEKHIDILITDARMPECDGIELIKWCAQNNLNVKSIVISGYRNFEYAHGALKYGVNAYLLKPINQNELVSSLKNIIKELRSEIQVNEASKQTQLRLTQSKEALRNHFISSYIFDGFQYSKQKTGFVDEINHEYQMGFKEDTYQAVMIKIDHDPDFDIQLDKLLNIIKKNADEFMTGFAHEYVSAIAHSAVVMLLNYDRKQGSEFKNKTEELLHALEKCIDAYDKVTLMIGVSETENTIQNIDKCIALAGEAVKFRIANPIKKIIYYEEYEYENKDIHSIITPERAEMLGSCIRNNNRTEAGKIVFDVKSQLHRIRNLSPVIIYAAISELGKISLKILENIVEDSDTCTRTKIKFYERIDSVSTEEALWNSLDKLFLECIELMNQEMVNQQTKPVRIIKAYIEENFGKAITLETAAERVNLTPNYVSTIFKKETGVSFLEYLTSVRLDKATEMLRKSDMSMSEIAEAVGYNDVKHFSKLCKKTLGMKPSEYRKLYS